VSIKDPDAGVNAAAAGDGKGTPETTRAVRRSTMTFAGDGAMAPAELGLRLGISGGATTSLLSMLAQEGKIRIGLAELPLPSPR